MANGRHKYGYNLPTELKWTSDDKALVGALLIHRAVSAIAF